MSSVLPQASLFLGVIPALILLYISLKGYEGYYKDKTIFLTFVLGLITGFIAALIEIYTIAVGILFIVLFPLLEQLFKTMILNLRRLQRKKETVIYGLSLGLGFGSIFTPVSIIIANIQPESNLVTLALTVIGSVGLILLHAATGLLVGYGVYQEKLAKYFIIALLLLLPYTGFIFITQLLEIQYLQLGLVIYGLIIYWYATVKIMPQILAENQPRKRSNPKIKTE